jgi:tetratricopeptide (TPR) repeat protein
VPEQSVHVRQELVSLPTYEPLAPDKHPMFLEKRVYQGSSGKVYPLPFFNRIAERKTDRNWKGIWLENQFIELLILPEIGGRIHVGRDKTNGYDFFYRQNVIKPALVGLAGPWISGGVEFNWPQHHRPATYLPVEVEIEEHADGSKTVWLSDHDPMSRMKGMHGVCLHPDKALVELKVRAYNRTPFVQTFLWWANVAARVHKGYQSFFPPDVTQVADHARRAITSYPLCDGSYYGVDYAGRAKHGVPASEIPAHFVPPHCAKSPESSAIPTYSANDLSWYANIPVPMSYMCLGSQKDFFGGYDHVRRAGLVHVANHHISPGKKQWTWGNHEFGYAWDRNLTDADGPYIELMAGVFTDNQPDFSFLQPGETKTWSQFWYPIRDIGPVQEATTEAALSLRFGKGKADIGVCVTERFAAATVRLSARGRIIDSWTGELSPKKTVTRTINLPPKTKAADLRLALFAADGREVIAWQPAESKPSPLPRSATEPAAPPQIASADKLYLAGLHLEQYRHATRSPASYWAEALRRDPGDVRCNNAMGLWHLKRGEFPQAEGFFRRAIVRQTERNANPYDGEPHYNLGLTLRFLNRNDEAYAAFYKAAWNQAWQSAAYHALAEIDCCRGHWPTALDHLDRSLRLNTDHLRARNLRAIVLRRLGREAEADRQLSSTLELDPLDAWARHLLGREIHCDTQTRIDLALDFARAGFFPDAIRLLEAADANATAGTAPLVAYYLGWLYEQSSDSATALRWFKEAAQRPPDYCFPARVEQIAILETALRINPGDARAGYYLGNLLYDKKRHAEAIRFWERSAKIDPAFSIVWRNLGIAYFNIRRQPAGARRAYDKAFAANPGESRLLYERDQLWKRLRVSPRRRLSELEQHRALVNERDDLTVELCALYNQTGQPARALEVIAARKFQPWEGGEGLALGQHVRSHLLLARLAAANNDLPSAQRDLESALASPENLGEAKHLLANQSDIHYRLGEIHAAQGDRATARHHWNLAASFRGDFQQMSVRLFSEMTYFSALSLQRLGRRVAAKKLFQQLLDYARKLQKTPARIDYFATSLPTMLLFDEDIQCRLQTTALFLEAQAHLGLGNRARATTLLKAVLRRDPSHGPAADLRAELAAGNTSSNRRSQSSSII